MANKRPPVKKAIINQFDGDNVPEDFEFPSIGIEDIDRSVFNLFDEVLQIETTSNGKARQVPVIFATGERFALTRRKKPLRDKNNANILPLISIVRENIDIGATQGGKNTAISFRAQPNYYVKNRLHYKDRAFQNILNKEGLINQENVSSDKNFFNPNTQTGIKENTVASRREKKNIKFSSSATVQLNNNINTNIYEMIQVPYPYFAAMTYNITFWCQYMQQGNEMIEYLLTKIRVPGGEFPIETKEGFELVAFIGDSINFSNSFDNMTDDERIIKYSFTLTVPGYILNPDAPGLPNQLRSFISAPQIDFTYYNSKADVDVDYQPISEQENMEKHVLSDITSVKELQNRRGESTEIIREFVENPFNNTEDKQFLKVKNSNSRTGESIVSSRITKQIDRQFE
jgi:hypothetical protein|tara:strand:- start:1385 stop:2587 length:1203 start_codon:yes stop_codon:yes gene_type:complete